MPRCFAAAAVLLFASLSLHAQEAPSAQAAWEQKLHARRDALVAEDGPGTDPELAATLLAMRDEDQAARFQNTKDAADKKPVTTAELIAIDRKLTAQLKTIVDEHGWPTIHMVGLDASNGATLLLTHARDHEWQRSLLPQLEMLAHDGKIDGSQLAAVVDKELVTAGKLQRYGTQFKVVDGQAMMLAVEEPATLEKRRDEVMLPPLDVYKKMLGDMYHVPVSDMIIRADAPK